MNPRVFAGIALNIIAFILFVFLWARVLMPTAIVPAVLGIIMCAAAWKKPKQNSSGTAA